MPLINDALVVSRETVLLSLNSPKNSALGIPATATMNIVDNDERYTPLNVDQQPTQRCE